MKKNRQNESNFSLFSLNVNNAFTIFLWKNRKNGMSFSLLALMLTKFQDLFHDFFLKKSSKWK